MSGGFDLNIQTYAIAFIIISYIIIFLLHKRFSFSKPFTLALLLFIACNTMLPIIIGDATNGNIFITYGASFFLSTTFTLFVYSHVWDNNKDSNQNKN